MAARRRFISIIAAQAGHIVATGAPEGYDALVLSEEACSRPVLHVCRDDARMAAMSSAVRFFAPELDVFEFPSLGLPSIRSSVTKSGDCRTASRCPRAAIRATNDGPDTDHGQCRSSARTIAIAFLTGGLTGSVGDDLPQEAFSAYFQRNGYRRSATVREPGEFAFRGGIVDVFPPGAGQPYRLDFFGDELETIRHFDPMSQRTTGTSERFVLGPVSEIAFDDASTERFREGYRLLFGPPVGSDPLYEAVSAGIHHPGVEHWLPLFSDGMETLFDYVPDAPVVLDHEAEQAIMARFELINEFYEARREMMPATVRDANDETPPYKPLPPERLYFAQAEWEDRLSERSVLSLFPFASGPNGSTTIDLGGRLTADFTEARHRQDVNLFDVFRERVSAETERKAVVFAFQQWFSRSIGWAS